MKYMLLIYSSPTTWASLSQQDREQMYRDHAELHDELVNSGEWVGGNALASPEYSKTVRVRSDAVLATDGPFTETKEHLAGYDVVDCADIERALEIAVRMPDARVCRVEVRPVVTPGEDT